MKRNIMLGYSAPEIEIFEVVAECGYGSSLVDDTLDFGTPSFGSDSENTLEW